MEFISAEEFLKQPEEVQNIFINWWQPSLGDLYVNDNYLKALPHCVWQSDNDLIFPVRGSLWEEKEKCIPLLTEGQLRKFIEKKGYGIELRYYDDKSFSYSLYEFDEGYDVKYEDDESDLMRVYWKVALEIIGKGKKGE